MPARRGHVTAKEAFGQPLESFMFLALLLQAYGDGVSRVLDVEAAYCRGRPAVVESYLARKKKRVDHCSSAITTHSSATEASMSAMIQTK